MKNTPVIYLISLKKETERRKKLKAQSPLSYNIFNLIDAIDKNTISSNDYFQAMMRTQKRLGKIISPAELACARSHLIAIQQFLESTHTHCLILEDDIIGTEQELEKALDATSQAIGNSIILCGTHINRRHNKYITLSHEKAKKINFLERHFIAGAFSYGLTRGAAQNIIEKQRQATYRSDHWISLAQNLDIYIIDALKHPENYNNSHIESERQILHKKTIEKIRHDGLGVTITKNLFKILILTYQNIRRNS